MCLLDTYNLEADLDFVPKQVQMHTYEPFEFLNILWFPVFKNQKLIYYNSSIDNLYLKLSPWKISIQNSWGVFWKGDNSLDYFSSEIEKTFFYLDYIMDGIIDISRPIKVAIGANINLDIDFQNLKFISLHNQRPTPMMFKGRIYGYKFVGSKETLKIYSKSQEQLLRRRFPCAGNIVRIELESNVNYLTKNMGIRLLKSSHILCQDIKKALAERLVQKLNRINMVAEIPKNLSLGDKRIVACMRDVEIKELIKSDHLETYRKDLKKYRNIQKECKSILSESIIPMTKEKLCFLINN